MEAVAWFAGQRHSDAPPCVSPYLRGFGIRLNDRASDEHRQDLLRFIPLLVGTAGDGLDDRRRWLGADHVVRTVAPKWLDKAGLTEHAAALRGLAPIVDDVTYRAARPVVYAARDAAWKLRVEKRRPLLAAVREAVTEKLADKAVAAAVAVAVAAAAAAADGRARWYAVRDAVYDKVRAIYEERYADVAAESWPDALTLFQRLIDPSAVAA